MPIYLAKFALCNVSGTRKSYILAVEDGATWLTDFEGKVAARFDAPLSEISVPPHKIPGFDIVIDSESIYRAEGTFVRFSKAGPEYLAIVASFAGRERSLFYVYSADGKLIYQEVLPARCNAIAALPKADGKHGQALIVGGGKLIWRYDER
ncbi:MAG: hypothetical protein L0220_33825 [Acidobacteria bacterium]|nr:hypothetical protein [Acidobacteriota bacterium]